MGMNTYVGCSTLHCPHHCLLQIHIHVYVQDILVYAYAYVEGALVCANSHHCCLHGSPARAVSRLSVAAGLRV